MDAETLSPAEADVQNRWILRAGAISAFAVFAGYLATLALYAWVGVAPSGGIEARLEHFGAHPNGWWAIASLMVVTDLLLLPLFLALYRALKGLGRDLMLLALVSIGLFVAADFAVTWTAHSVLIAAGSDYVATTSDSARAALVAGAAYPSAILDSPVAGLCAIALPALGVLLSGLVMLRGVFNKATASVALVAGVTGIASMGSYLVDALSALAIVNAVLMMVTYLLAGIRLYRLGRR